MKEDPLLPKIGGYVDGELTPAERAEVEELIEGSSEHRAVAEELHWVDQIARSGDVPRVSEDEWSHLKNAVLAQAQAAPQTEAETGARTAETLPFPAARSRAAWVPLAALFLFGLILAWALVARTPQEEPAGGNLARTPDTPTQNASSALEEMPPAEDDKGVAPEKSVADRDLYTPRVENEDDFTGVYYDEDF